VPQVGGVAAPWRMVATLFGESASRILISADPREVPSILARARDAGVPARAIGTTGDGRIRIAIDGETAIDVALSTAEQLWAHALEQKLARKVA
jgi:phosphoribosylformylglycinamidine synthase subunit PurL